MAESPLAYRLPTEAELEYALRGDGADSDAWRETEDVCDYANVADQSYSSRLPSESDTRGFARCNDGFPTISPVGNYVANHYGLCDLYWNVWEWASDCWHDNYEGYHYRQDTHQQAQIACAKPRAAIVHA